MTTSQNYAPGYSSIAAANALMDAVDNIDDLDDETWEESAIDIDDMRSQLVRWAEYLTRRSIRILLAARGQS
ncbi:hypothetical protein [Acidipropionibacterium timonense]|uniref:hypothetical protein n=1 Tax=Acidipropionibacterium timonense TaxID=2161818 RepID=UPI001030B6C2|nr:hypothetical protein [Acidipropionibacterium timonense]